MSRIFFKIIILSFVILPYFSYAEIIISEIMYDVEGSDANREWIEIYNNGSSSVNISDYHFFEAGIHHGLNSDEKISLGSGEYAVIVQNVSQFISEYSSVRNILKSSFSLNNSGEELAISDESKEIVYVTSYGTDSQANGNGNSLSFGNNGWFESSPSPGKSANTNVSKSAVPVDENFQQKTRTELKPVLTRDKDLNYYEGFIDIPDFGLVYSDIPLEAYIIHHKGYKKIKKLKGVYYLSFGDGNYFDSKERYDISHVYENPGNYTITLEYYSSQLAKQAGKDPNLVVSKDIVIYKSDIVLEGVNESGGFVIKNNLEKTVDLKGWNFFSEGKQFTFPRYTHINANQKKIIPHSVHGLSNMSNDQWVILRNENNRTISSFTGDPIKNKNSNKDQSLSLVSGKSNALFTQESVAEEDSFSVKINDFDERYLQQHPDKIKAVFGSVNNNQKHTSPSTSPPLYLIIFFGILSLFLVFIRGVRNKRNQEESEVIGDIDVI